MAQQKYSIVHKLDAGGMAEVWKGKATSMRGFEKLVAIKRVLPDLAKKDTFINMFLDEARLSLHLNHANVVQTFDIGTSEGAYFIVMEWVDGMNLKGILESIKLSGDRIPVEQALFIAKELCKGLHHAHRRKTPDGQPLNIVHRDISPPNLLISREGEVKVVDFGLAKAATQAMTTDQGMVKGKFSYLSPEAAWGHPLDERADIFAVGALIWEMLAGRRLFEGETNKATVLMIREAVIPSLENFNPYVDDELMQIINRSLAREPNDRYSTAKDLGQDIVTYLFKHQLTVTSYDIADLVENTLAEKDKDRRLEPEWFDEIGQVEEQLVQFTSLEDLHRMSFRAEAEESGIRNPNLLKGEDPRGWAAELGISLTPTPIGMNGDYVGGGAQLDMTSGESEAKGAFALNQGMSATNLSPVQTSERPQPKSTVQTAKKQTNSFANDEVEIEEEPIQGIKWWIYPLVALVLMVVGLVAGKFLAKQNSTIQQQVQPAQPATTNPNIVNEEKTTPDEQEVQVEEDDIILEEEINFE